MVVHAEAVSSGDFCPADIVVVIPTRERWRILAQTLSGLRRQSVSGFEVMVVIDGTDQTPVMPTDVRFITTEHGGPGNARNAGVRATDRSLVLFLGDDMVPDGKLVERHLAAHNRHPSTESAVLGHVEVHPKATSRLNRWMDRSGSQFDYRNIEGRKAGFGRFYSCNVSLKREFFLAAGGFDKEFVYYYEDLDCGWRLHQRGLELYYEPSALALHLHRLTWQDVIRRFRGVARGERLMAMKHPWFSPFFAGRFRSALEARRVSRIWPLIVDLVPHSASRVRRGSERRADLWYHQALASHFFDAWESERDLEGLREPD